LDIQLSHFQMVDMCAAKNNHYRKYSTKEKFIEGG
jgi:hypothetical protein